MIVQFDASRIGNTKWHEYLARFIFGGLITALTGVIADKWGPVVAGLFLAFPAIFPAGATLLEKHERERKAKRGLNGEERGTDAAADDAVGTTMGSTGLIVFALTGWLLLARHSAVLVLTAATAAWWATAAGLWFVRKRYFRRRL